MTLSSLLLKEKVVSFNRLGTSRLKGFLRIVQGNRKTLGFFIDENTFSELLEAIQYNDTKFWEEIESSRKSGRISSKRIERELGIKK